jgi:DNA primase
VPRDWAELKNQVKAASDILDVISGYVPIQNVGKASKCICPFHNDTRPSMQIDRKWQNYHCWSCGAKGDVFTFVEKYEKVNFLEALAILARRAGIAMEEATASPQEAHKVQLFEVMKWAQMIFQQNLLEASTSQAARKYLGERQLSGQSVRQFGLGFAPLAGDWLVQQAAKDRVPFELLVEVGLISERDEGQGYFDRFRDRVIFPIRDAQGRPVGFGGRIMPDSPYAARGPKYYNTSETPLFKKQEQLYGIDLARHAGSAAGFLAVVEGYTDVMMAHQSGITNVVATMGTALNARHVAQLVRYVKKIVLVFDNDEGGNKGVDRALEIFVSQDVELAVARLPDGLDPADLLSKEGGVEIFRDCLAKSVDALEFKLDQLFASPESASVDGIRRMLDIILGIIALAPPVPSQSAQMKQELILNRLGHRLGIELRTVRARLKELQVERRRQEQRQAEREPEPIVQSSAARITAPPSSATQRKSGAAPVLERQLLQILLAEPELVASAHAAIPLDTISHTGLKRMLLELYAIHEQNVPADLDHLRVRLIDRPDLATAAIDLQQAGRSISDRPLYFNQIVNGFAKLKTEAEKKQLKDQLGSQGLDDTAALELLRRLQGPKKEAG